MKDFLIQFSKGCIVSLNQSLNKVTIRVKPSAIHALRLDIKKLKVLLSLLETLDIPINTKSEMKSLSTIFKLAGKIREVQIQPNLIKRYRKDYPKEAKRAWRIIKNGRKKAVKAFMKELSRYCSISNNNTMEIICGYLETSNAETIEEKWREYSLLLLEQLINMTRKRPNGEQLHTIRLNLKKYIFVISLRAKANGEQPDEISQIAWLNQLQQQLGDWHDLDVLYTKLNGFNTPKAKLALLLQQLELDIKTREVEILHGLLELRRIRISF